MPIPPRLRFFQLICILFLLLPILKLTAQRVPAELAWSMQYDPKTFDPALVDDQASEMIRYLTGGVLLRMNRRTQAMEPDLASNWSLSADGRTLTFHLRQGLQFSDGSPLTASDVAWTLRRVLATATAAPVAQEFVSPADVQVTSPDNRTVILKLPKRIVGIEKVFDEIAIQPAGQPSGSRVTAGSYVVSEYQRGQFLRLTRNPHYWNHDASGAQLPYIPVIRLDILSNREQELQGFLRGNYQLIGSLQPEYYSVLARRDPGTARDLGPSLNTEQMWFNQAPAAPLAAYEKHWFQNRSFRLAISKSIHRADLARIAYDGHATPAYGFISPSNTAWYDRQLQYPQENVETAKDLLKTAGFHTAAGVLYDPENHPVKFSILTNAGNRPREQMATMIQQDLATLGIRVTVVTLDFPALIERLMHTQDYEACLLGLVNVDPDPNAMMNLWLSSSPNHQWDPSEKTPATPWEAAIDKWMEIQATSASPSNRRHAIDQIQQIVADQQPFIYLVYPNAVSAVSLQLSGLQPSVLQPGLVWNIDRIRWSGEKP